MSILPLLAKRLYYVDVGFSVFPTVRPQFLSFEEVGTYMKKRMTAKKILSLLVLVALATVFAAVPAFATGTSQISIVGLSASLDEVPEPRMFTEPWMFSPDSDPSNPDTRFPSDGQDYTFSDAEPHEGLVLHRRGPHGGYTTTSAKCAVCHSAHSAAAEEGSFDRGGDPNMVQPRGYALLRQGSTGCEYCHLTGSAIGGAAGMSSRIVYTGGMADGTSDLDPDSGHSLKLHATVPNSDLIDFNLTCSSCHAVHGNFGTWQPREFYRNDNPLLAGIEGDGETVTTLGYRLLRNNPGRRAEPVAVGDADPSKPAVDQDQINQFTMNVWCASCHNAPSLDKPMTSMRSFGLDTGSGKSIVEYFDLLVTEFTVNSNYNVHDEEGRFATSFGDELNLPNEEHATSFYGVYSGPGQCYTCHRGDLGGPRTAQWTSNGIVPIPDADNPPLDDPVMMQLRALDYFALSGANNAERLEQQARSLACASCHFGTADYARWSPMSDWPHRSPAGDLSLLGLVPTTGLEAGQTYPTSDDIPELFCGRCHVFMPADGTSPDRFVISHHFIEHGDVSNEGNMGNLFPMLSPGNPPENNGSGTEPTP